MMVRIVNIQDQTRYTVVPLPKSSFWQWNDFRFNSSSSTLSSSGSNSSFDSTPSDNEGMEKISKKSIELHCFKRNGSRVHHYSGWLEREYYATNKAKWDVILFKVYNHKVSAGFVEFSGGANDRTSIQKERHDIQKLYKTMADMLNRYPSDIKK
ncbi:hypothetical protein RO3G_16435 [Rhizopus delemar RA 99-880]|uniref:Uncharacterized protein n=1 Tax=Rhizopus delemar (strain RA 99-880 / ATCC MYA-4621 / FGSC 9543 / NRRL 43880) TaxID=246409 RepID=I1CTE4_RHIO9|nr:hypothetical protein RO3G_16435 [Rhizopus delemar RA 99-880]|eukprot:EIE91724.1 hypothetical protein RO3G_16435 [Rhizopus delemar RA 99-880]